MVSLPVRIRAGLALRVAVGRLLSITLGLLHVAGRLLPMRLPLRPVRTWRRRVRRLLLAV